MKIKFCGAAQTVTGSCHLLTLDNGFSILMDAGLYQGRDKDFNTFNSKWLFDPKDVDCMILSHAHIDHAGRIPKLVADGFKGQIFCTNATRDLSAVMLLDSAQLQERDTYFTNKRLTKHGETPDAKPLYQVNDVTRSMTHFIGISYDKWYHINDQVSVLLKDSGHILGSASVTLRIKEPGKDVKHFGFSGDIGRPERPILKDPDPLTNLDYLICESTYGGRTHSVFQKDKDQLLRIINETCVEKRGKLLIPAFSVGRTQEIVYSLDKLETAKLLPKIPVFIDSPMAINATEIFRLHPECFDQEILKYMLKDPNPFGFNDLHYVRKSSQSKELNHLKGPAIIISASGMMTGGRIVHHLLNHIEDPDTTILVVGYCAPHTLGAKIREGNKKIRIYGSEKTVRARVEIMDSFSAHGDQPEMIEYLSSLDKKQVQTIFLTHGEINRQTLFKEALIKDGFQDVQIPKLGQEFTL